MSAVAVVAASTYRCFCCRLFLLSLPAIAAAVAAADASVAVSAAVAAAVVAVVNNNSSCYQQQ